MITYIAINKYNGKCYIGMTSSTLARRVSYHMDYVRGGSMTAFHCALRKYGFDAFTFIRLGTYKTRGEMQAAEISLIKSRGTMLPDGYNMTPGGDGWYGPHSTRTKRKQSKSHKQRWAQMPPEQRIAIRRAISLAKKGKPQPWAKVTGKKNLGRKRSKAFKSKVSAGVKRMIASLPPGEMARRGRCRKKVVATAA